MLTKVPKGKDINDGDKFVFNKDFTNALFKIILVQYKVCVSFFIFFTYLENCEVMVLIELGYMP